MSSYLQNNGNKILNTIRNEAADSSARSAQKTRQLQIDFY